LIADVRGDARTFASSAESIENCDENLRSGAWRHWARFRFRIDPRTTIVHEPSMTTNLGSPTLYQIFVHEGFFEQFPAWRAYIEQ